MSSQKSRGEDLRERDFGALLHLSNGEDVADADLRNLEKLGLVKNNKLTAKGRREIALSKPEASELARHQTVVAEWDKQTFNAAESLHHVLHKRLYRATHRTFESWISDNCRHEITRQTAYNLANWWHRNHIAGRDDAPLSVRATNRLKGLSEPETKKVIKSAEKLAKQAGEDVPTEKHVEQAAKTLKMNDPTPPMSTVEPKEIRYHLTIWTDHRMEVLAILEDLQAANPDSVKVNKRGKGSEPMHVVLASLRTFFSAASKLLENCDEIDFAVKGDRKVVKPANAKSDKAA